MVHHTSSRAHRGNQAGVTEMQMGARGKGRVTQKVNQKERARWMARPSSRLRGSMTISTRKVAHAAQVLGDSWAMGSMKPSSWRLVQKVFTTEHRREISPRARYSHSFHSPRPHSPASTARGRVHHRRGRDQVSRLTAVYTPQPPSRKRGYVRTEKAETKENTVPYRQRNSRMPSPRMEAGGGRKGGRLGRSFRFFMSGLLSRPGRSHGSGGAARRRGTAGGPRPGWTGRSPGRSGRRPGPGRPAGSAPR